MEFLPDLAGVGTGGIAGGWRYLSGHITADGHGVPGHIGQVAARSGGVGANEAVVHTLDLDDCTGQAGGRIVRIHLADAAISGNNGRIHEGDDHFRAVITGQHHILGTGVVDLVALRSFQLCDGIGASLQRADLYDPVPAGDHLFGKGTVVGLDQEFSAGQPLVGVGSIYLLDGQLILLSGHGEPANKDRLHIIGRVVGGAGTCIVVLIDITFAPDTLLPKGQDVVRPVTEGPAVQFIVNVGIMGTAHIIEDIHQFFRAGFHRVGEKTSLVTPDDCLHPGIHHPDIVRPPCLSDTEGDRLIGENAGGVAIEVGHHVLHSRVRDGLRLVPFMAFQRPPHALALFGAEAHDIGPAEVIAHLVHIADAQCRRLIAGSIVGAVGQFDRTRRGFCGKCGCGKQPKQADQHQKRGNDTGMREMNRFHNRFLSFRGKKGRRDHISQQAANRLWGPDPNGLLLSVFMMDCYMLCSSMTASDPPFIKKAYLRMQVGFRCKLS